MQNDENREREIQGSIRQVLLKDWDPIGIGDDPDAQDEYDDYIGGVYKLLFEGSSENEIVNHLKRIETEQIGLTLISDNLNQVARKLMLIVLRS